MTPRIVVRAITVFAAGALLLSPAFAQTKGGNTGTGTTGNTGNTGSTGNTGTIGNTGNTGSLGGTTNTPGRTTNPTNPTNQPTYQQPIMISGRVVVEDGTPPPEPAVIERVCFGNAHAEGYTDSHGNFMIQLGNDTGVFQDASESAGPGSMMGVPTPMGTAGPATPGTLGTTGRMSGSVDNPYSNCELRAKLSGYRSQTVSLATRRPMDDPNIGTILLHREGPDEGTTVSKTSLLAPKAARKAFTKGQDARKKKKIDDAADDYARAVQLYPEYAEAWFELGLIQVGRMQVSDARHSFEQAIQGDPKFVNPYVELSIIQMNAKQWPQLADLSAKAIKLDPFDYPQLYLFNAVADYNTRDYDSAEKSVREALRLDTRHAFPDNERLMGLVLMQKHEYADAAEHLKAYLKIATDSQETELVKKELAQLEGALAQNKQ